LRQYLSKESEKEALKTNLLAMLVTNSVPFTDQNAAREWEQKIRKIYITYLGLEHGIEIPEHSDEEVKMMKYYKDKVQKLKPKLNKNSNGNFVVSGLDSLKE
jgi:hypothetical protein